MSKAEVKPEDNIWVNLSMGALSVMGESEIGIHAEGNRLYYGYGIEFGKVSRSINALPFVNLEDLKKLKRFSINYQRLDNHTEARRTIFGRLYVRRSNYHRDYSRFSRKEFKTIEQYL